MFYDAFKFKLKFGGIDLILYKKEYLVGKTIKIGLYKR